MHAHLSRPWCPTACGAAMQSSRSVAASSACAPAASPSSPNAVPVLRLTTLPEGSTWLDVDRLDGAAGVPTARQLGPQERGHVFPLGGEGEQLQAQLACEQLRLCGARGAHACMRDVKGAFARERDKGCRGLLTGGCVHACAGWACLGSCS